MDLASSKLLALQKTPPRPFIAMASTLILPSPEKQSERYGTETLSHMLTRHQERRRFSCLASPQSSHGGAGLQMAAPGRFLLREEGIPSKGRYRSRCRYQHLGLKRSGRGCDQCSVHFRKGHPRIACYWLGCADVLPPQDIQNGGGTTGSTGINTPGVPAKLIRGSCALRVWCDRHIYFVPLDNRPRDCDGDGDTIVIDVTRWGRRSFICKVFVRQRAYQGDSTAHTFCLEANHRYGEKL